MSDTDLSAIVLKITKLQRLSRSPNAHEAASAAAEAQKLIDRHHLGLMFSSGAADALEEHAEAFKRLNAAIERAKGGAR